MNDAFTFERPDWELLLEGLKPGSTLSAIRFLAALEPEDEAAFEEAYEVILNKAITLDASKLPADYGSGELEKQLRREEELVRAGGLPAGLEETDPLRLYLEELARIPAQGDPAVLAEALLQGDESAGQKLVNLYLHRAVELAQEYTGRGVLLLDLMQEAGLGLWQGILQYAGGDLDAHIDWWIRQSVLRPVLLQARQSGVIHSLQKCMEAYGQADRRLLMELGRNATVEELAVELGITPEQADVIRDMIQNAAQMEKVKQPPKTDESEEERAVEDTAYFQSRQRIAELLSTLTEKEAQVLSLRFGLDGAAPATPEAVGVKLGMTVEQVVAMEGAALTKLRNEEKGE